MYHNSLKIYYNIDDVIPIIQSVLDEPAFHINLKRGMAWSKKGTPAVVTVPTTKANATSILGTISVISATGLLFIDNTFIIHLRKME